MSPADRPAVPPDLHRQLARDWGAPGWRGTLGAVNHSVVGLRFMATGAVYFLIGGLLAMLIRAQLATSGNAFLDHGAYAQVFTMHGTVMMFLFAIPFLEGVALYLLPKLLGARDLAFPRLSAFGYWCYLFGGMILLAGLVLGIAPDTGWFMYTPLSSKPFTPGINADIWLIGITFVEVSAMCAGVEFCATILKVRAAGMSLDRMPLFAWYILVTAVMILVGFPPLILGSILLELERAFDLPFFDVGRGGDPLLWQHLFWMFGHPEVYIIFLPAAGVVTTILPTFARHPVIGYSWIVASVVATGFISFGLWVHHMFTVGIPHLALAFFSAASMLVAIPTGIQVFAWIATLWAGRPVVRLPMLYLFGFLFVFVAGGLTGVMVALVPFDWQVHDTHFVVAHLHYVLVGGFVFPMLAGLYYWMPQLTGRLPSESLGKLAFWLIFVGFNATFFVMHLTGLMGMPRRVYTYPEGLGWDALNLVSSIGGFVMAAGFAALLLDLFLHVRAGPASGRNPWRAGTLEWAMPAPPPVYNFASLPAVTGREPLHDDPDLADRLAAGDGYLAGHRPGWRETLSVDVVTGRPAEILLLPGPPLLPLSAALALALFFVSFLLSAYWLAALGAAAATALLMRWAWQTGMRDDPQPLAAGHGATLPPHPAVERPPGWWGTVFTLVADGTFYVSLLFGYLYLWTVAPHWPPPSFVDPHPVVPFVALAALAAGALAARRAFMANQTGARAARMAWLAAAALGGILGCGSFLAVPLAALPPLQSHAYAAIAAALSGYMSFHCAVAAILSVHGAMRCRAGFVSAVRCTDLRIHRMWWSYTASTGAVTVAALYLLPVLLAPS